MRLAAIAQQLRDQCPALRKSVAVLTTSAPQVQLPFAGVLLLTEVAKPNTLLGAHSQEIVATFGVEIAIRHAAQVGNSGKDSPLPILLEQLREEIIPALAGWSPAAEHSPCDFVAGKLVGYRDGVMYWLDQFSTTFYR